MGGLKYYKAVLNCMNDQVYVRDLEMNILYINPAAEKLTGWTLSEAIGKKCYDIFGDEKRGCLDVCPVEKAISANRSIAHHEGELKTRKGNIRKMQVSISPIKEDGDITGGIVVMQDITDFKELQESHIKTLIKMQKMQKSLQESEYCLKQAQELAGVGSWHFDIVADVLTWSEQTYRMFGIDRQTPLNIAIFMERVHPDDQSLVKSAWKAALKGEAYDIEHRIVVGIETRWVHEKAKITFDKDGSPLFSIGTVLDITERKQAEAQERFQAQIMDQMHDSVIATDMDGMINGWNNGSVRLFHYAPKDVIGMHVSMLYPSYSHAHLRESIIPTLLSRGSHEYQTRLIRKDGTEFDALVSLSVLRDVAGKTIGMIGYTLDITDKERVQKALADSEQRLSDIIEFLPDPTWVIDIDERIIAWNRAVEKITGIKKKDILGKGRYAHAIPFYGEPRPTLVNLVLNRDERWEKQYLNIKEENGIPTAAESFHQKMGDKGRYLSTSAARLYNANGNVIGAIQSVRDITLTKQFEQEREKLINDLQTALDNVRTLSGLLPMCTNCKGIRGDKGYWRQLETYISQHTDADVSHGLCPECMDKMYGGQDWYESDRRGKESTI